MKFIWSFILLVVITVVFSSSTSCQEDFSSLTLHLKNGDVLTGVTEITTIPFSTLYGNLAFPVNDVNTITLGISTKGVDRGLLYEQLDKIQFGTVEEAERAFDKLVRYETKVIPMIRDYMEEPDYRPKQFSQVTVEILFDVMLEMNDLPKNFSTDDVVVFMDDYKVNGSYTFETISISTDFGDLLIKRSDIKIIEVQLSGAELHSKSFKLLADKHIIANSKDGWLKTGMLVKAGDLISISSEGEVQLESLDGNTYTPDGGVNGSPGPEGDQPSFGNVVFKIGEGGPTVKAGDSYKAASEMTGILYLSIFESVYNSGNDGYYISKVRVD